MNGERREGWAAHDNRNSDGYPVLHQHRQEAEAYLPLDGELVHYVELRDDETIVDAETTEEVRARNRELVRCLTKEFSRCTQMAKERDAYDEELTRKAIRIKELEETQLALECATQARDAWKRRAEVAEAQVERITDVLNGVDQ